MAKSLWNIGDHEHPVIQGQAGKPYYHEKGPTLKFENQEQPVDNSCLCKYPYQRYYWIYAKVDEDTKNINFFTQDFHYTASDSIDYTIEGKQGWEWELCSSYQSAGCHSKTATGKWQPVSIFPYSQQCSDAQQTVEYNLTFPSPKYIGIQDKNASITLNQRSIPTPFRTNTGAPSLMRMLVSSYKCCNGETGCGKVTQPKNTWVDVPGGHFCSQWFIATWDCEEADPVLYTALSRASQGECTQGGYYEDETIPLTCNTVKIRRHRERLVLDDMELQDCRQCFQNLYTDILDNQKPPPVDGRRYRLYKYPVEVSIQTYEGQYYAQRVCKWGTPYKIQNEAWNSVPPQIRGAGQGCLPYGAHDTKPQITCSQGSYGVEAWQWAQSQNCYTEPEVPNTLTGDIVTGQECNCIELQIQSFFSDSAVLPDYRDSKDPPCNIPDPPPYKYRRLDFSWDIPQFQHTKFDVYRVRLYANGKDSPQDDACISYLEPDRDSHGRLKWDMVLMQNYDYEIFQKGYLSKIQNRFSSEGEQGAYTYWYYTVVRSDCDPEVDQKDLSQGWAGMLKSPWEGQCPVYFAVYWNPQEDCTMDAQGNRVVVRPHGRGCTVWERLGALSDEALSANYIFPDIWTPYKFSQDPQVWGYRYVVKTQAGTRSYCQEVPQLPSLTDYKVAVWVIGKWEPDCDVYQATSSMEDATVQPQSWTPQIVIGKGAPLICSYPSGCTYIQDTEYVPCRLAGSGQLQYGANYERNTDPNAINKAGSTFPVSNGFYGQKSDASYIPISVQSGNYNVSVPQGACSVFYVKMHYFLLQQANLYFSHKSPVPLELGVQYKPYNYHPDITWHGITYKGRYYYSAAKNLSDYKIRFNTACCAKHYYSVAWTCNPNGSFSRVTYTNQIPSSCASKRYWRYLGSMSKKQFTQTYVATNTWLRYKSSPSSYILMYIIESQNPPTSFCQTPPSQVPTLEGIMYYWVGDDFTPECRTNGTVGKIPPSSDLAPINSITYNAYKNGCNCGVLFQTKVPTADQTAHADNSCNVYLPMHRNSVGSTGQYQFRYTGNKIIDWASAGYRLSSTTQTGPPQYCQAFYGAYVSTMPILKNSTVQIQGRLCYIYQLNPVILYAFNGSTSGSASPSTVTGTYNGASFNISVYPANIRFSLTRTIRFSPGCAKVKCQIYYMPITTSMCQITSCSWTKGVSVQVLSPDYAAGQPQPTTGIYWGRDGNIKRAPNGFYTSYNPSNNFGSWIDQGLTSITPPSCSTFYYVRYSLHCPDAQPTAPSCTFNNDSPYRVLWYVPCKTRVTLNVLTIGPFPADFGTQTEMGQYTGYCKDEKGFSSYKTRTLIKGTTPAQLWSKTTFQAATTSAQLPMAYQNQLNWGVYPRDAQTGLLQTYYNAVQTVQACRVKPNHCDDVYLQLWRLSGICSGDAPTKESLFNYILSEYNMGSNKNSTVPITSPSYYSYIRRPSQCSGGEQDYCNIWYDPESKRPTVTQSLSSTNVGTITYTSCTISDYDGGGYSRYDQVFTFARDLGSEGFPLGFHFYSKTRAQGTVSGSGNSCPSSVPMGAAQPYTDINAVFHGSYIQRWSWYDDWISEYNACMNGAKMKWRLSAFIGTDWKSGGSWSKSGNTYKYTLPLNIFNGEYVVPNTPADRTDKVIINFSGSWTKTWTFSS